MQSLDAVPQVRFSPLLHRNTLEEFYALPDPDDRSHYELIGGFLFMCPPPDPPHGSIDARLTRSLFQFLLAHEIPGEVHHPREPIYADLHEGIYLEPDMMFVERQRTSSLNIFRRATLSTIAPPRPTPISLSALRELWLIDQSTTTIEVRHAGEHKGKLAWETWRYSEGARAESRV